MDNAAPPSVIPPGSSRPTGASVPPDAAGDPSLVESVRRLQGVYQQLRSELGRVIVGQETVLEQLLIAIFAQGHCLLEGVPGLAKTLMVSSLARCLRLQFSRIQFTPDLTPSDITGTEVLQEDKMTGKMAFKFLRCPGFAIIGPADETNRTPPKTQAA